VLVSADEAKALGLDGALPSLCLISCTTSTEEQAVPGSCQKPANYVMAQVPTWSRGDMEFFLHGSMGTEVVPEKVLQAFRATYPDLFPARPT